MIYLDHNATTPMDPDVFEAMRPWFMERFEQAYVTQLEDFAQKVLAGQPPSITIDDGISALRIALAATRSAHEKRPVELNEIALSQGA